MHDDDDDDNKGKQKEHLGELFLLFFIENFWIGQVVWLINMSTWSECQRAKIFLYKWSIIMKERTSLHF